VLARDPKKETDAVVAELEEAPEKRQPADADRREKGRRLDSGGIHDKIM